MRVRRVPVRTLIALTAVAVLALSACGDDEDAADTAAATATAGEVTVSDAWSRQPAEGQTVTAVYATVSNATDADVTIVAATSPTSDDVQLHDTIMGDDGTMTMKQKEGGFVVPAGGELVFESGGPHIMLMDIDPATYPDMVDVTLELDDGDTVAFSAEVRAVDGGEMDMDHDESMSESGDHRAESTSE